MQKPMGRNDCDSADGLDILYISTTSDFFQTACDDKLGVFFVFTPFLSGHDDISFSAFSGMLRKKMTRIPSLKGLIQPDTALFE